MRPGIVLCFTAVLTIAIGICVPGTAQEVEVQWSRQQKELLDVSRSLSKTTRVDGTGWQDYGEFLHPEFSRWSAAAGVINREDSINMIRDWWKAGNRQASGDEKVLSIQIVAATGVVRKNMVEKYLDDKGQDAGSFSGFVTQVWVRENEAWKLLSATIQKAAD